MGLSVVYHCTTPPPCSAMFLICDLVCLLLKIHHINIQHFKIQNILLFLDLTSRNLDEHWILAERLAGQHEDELAGHLGNWEVMLDWTRWILIWKNSHSLSFGLSLFLKHKVKSVDIWIATRIPPSLPPLTAMLVSIITSKYNYLRLDSSDTPV